MRLWSLVALAVALAVHPAWGAGALFVNDAGNPLVWTERPVPWNPDAGTLGSLDHTAALQLVAESFATWSEVPTAAISFANTGGLAVDVTAANVGLFLNVCDDATSPIVFDADGTITDALFGAGASNSILGFAGPECGTFDPPVVTEASAVLNGKFLDGVAAVGNPEVPLAAFAGVLVHEFGHYVNLDHSQINLLEAFDGNPANDDAIATMFPFLSSGPEARTLAKDDAVSLSLLYPAATFASTTGRITGEIRRGDTNAAFQGAFVVARNLADPRRDAVGMVSGARLPPGSTDPAALALVGAYELPGLNSGGSYVVEVEAVSPLFSGGSGVGPVSPPVALPGPPEQWSGAAEAGANPPDDPAAPGTPVLVSAGATRADVDIVLNVTPPPPNDACTAATPIASFPFTATLDTRIATTAATDPTPGCVVAPNPKTSKSVWFQVISALAGAVTISTGGSSYDTVIAAHTGSCSGLAPIGCDDDGGGDLTSVLTFPVAAATPYLVEITDYASTGGILEVSATFDVVPPPSCLAPAPGGCIPGTGAPSTDCVSEWLVQPAPPPTTAKPGPRNVPSYRVSCTDGDPRCDFDGVPGKNGQCVFHVALCINAHDPRLATRRCVPSTLASYRVLTPRIARPRDDTDLANATTLLGAALGLAVPPAATLSGNQVSFLPALATPDRCTTLRRFQVPIGTRVLRTRATTATGRSDGDQLRLRCLR